jgi:hypothetical protein
LNLNIVKKNEYRLLHDGVSGFNLLFSLKKIKKYIKLIFNFKKRTKVIRINARTNKIAKEKK